MRLRDRIHDALHEHRLQLLRDNPNQKKGSVLVTLCILYYAIALFKLLRGK